MRPAGMRPAGMRPAGMRPAGMRPAGMRPAGMRPAGMRPAGMRPAGMRPAGMRPAGMRPAGMRPAGMRDDDYEYGLPEAFPDANEWSADIAELFCAHSAVIRLGARLVFGDGEILVPDERLQGVPQYLPPPERTDLSPEGADRLQEGLQQLRVTAERSRATVTRRHLRPREHELTVRLVIRDQLIRALVEHSEASWALKEDVARALAQRADEAFLHGPTGGDPPQGITESVDPFTGPGDLLQIVRGMVAKLRREEQARFGSAGWVLHPTTLAALTQIVTANATKIAASGTTLDALGSGQLLAYDGSDGGLLLGYPFVVSAAAAEGSEGQERRIRIYFSSDWSEAWIGAEPGLLTVHVSADARFQTDETVLRAVARHDFLVRTPSCFTYTGEVLSDTPLDVKQQRPRTRKR